MFTLFVQGASEPALTATSSSKTLKRACGIAVSSQQVLLHRKRVLSTVRQRTLHKQKHQPEPEEQQSVRLLEVRGLLKRTRRQKHGFSSRRHLRQPGQQTAGLGSASACVACVVSPELTVNEQSSHCDTCAGVSCTQIVTSSIPDATSVSAKLQVLQPGRSFRHPGSVGTLESARRTAELDSIACLASRRPWLRGLNTARQHQGTGKGTRKCSQAPVSCDVPRPAMMVPSTPGPMHPSHTASQERSAQECPNDLTSSHATSEMSSPASLILSGVKVPSDQQQGVADHGTARLLAHLIVQPVRHSQRFFYVLSSRLPAECVRSLLMHDASLPSMGVEHFIVTGAPDSLTTRRSLTSSDQALTDFAGITPRSMFSLLTNAPTAPRSLPQSATTWANPDLDVSSVVIPKATAIKSVDSCVMNMALKQHRPKGAPRLLPSHCKPYPSRNSTTTLHPKTSVDPNIMHLINSLTSNFWQHSALCSMIISRSHLPPTASLPTPPVHTQPDTTYSHVPNPTASLPVPSPFHPPTAPIGNTNIILRIDIARSDPCTSLPASPFPPSSPLHRSYDDDAKVINKAITRCTSWRGVRAKISQYDGCLDHIHLSTALVQVARTTNFSTLPPTQHTAVHGFIDYLLSLVSTVTAHLESRHVCNILWSCATLEHKINTRLLHHIVMRAEALVPRFTSQGWSTLLWALSSLGYVHSQRITNTFFMASMSRLHAFKPQELSCCILSLARMHQRPWAEWMEHFFSATASHFSSACSQTLSNIIWALASLHSHSISTPNPPREWLRGFEFATLHALSTFDTQALTLTIWGLAKFGWHASDEFLQEFMHHFSCQIAYLEPRQLAMITWSLANLNTPLDAAQLHAVKAAMLTNPQVPADGHALSITLWALTQMKLLQQEPEFMHALLTATTPHLPSYSPQSLANCVWVAAVVHSRRPLPDSTPGKPQPWLDAFLVATEDRLGDFRSRELTRTVWGVARLAANPVRRGSASPVGHRAGRVGAAGPAGCPSGVAPASLVLPAWCRQAAAHLSQQLSDLDPVELSTSVTGLVMLSHPPPASFMPKFMAHVLDNMASLSGTSLADLLWVLAWLRYRPAGEWLQGAVQRAEGVLGCMSGRKTLQLVLALRHLGALRELGVLRRAVQQACLRSAASRQPPKVVLQGLSSLLYLPGRPSAEWLAEFATKLAAALPGKFSWAQLLRLLHALVALGGGSPPPAWFVDQVASHVVSQLEEEFERAGMEAAAANVSSQQAACMSDSSDLSVIAGNGYVSSMTESSTFGTVCAAPGFESNGTAQSTLIAWDCDTTTGVNNLSQNNDEPLHLELRQARREGVSSVDAAADVMDIQGKEAASTLANEAGLINDTNQWHNHTNGHAPARYDKPRLDLPDADILGPRFWPPAPPSDRIPTPAVSPVSFAGFGHSFVVVSASVMDEPVTMPPPETSFAVPAHNAEAPLTSHPLSSQSPTSHPITARTLASHPILDSVDEEEPAFLSPHASQPFPPSLSNLPRAIHALARQGLFHSCPSLSRCLLSLHPLAPLLPLRSLANITACATIHGYVVPPPWISFLLLSLRTCPSLSTLSPMELLRLLWCCAKWQVPAPGTLTSRVWSHSGGVLNALGTRRLCDLIWALTSLSLKPPLGWGSSLVYAVESRVERLPLQSLLYAFHTLQVRCKLRLGSSFVKRVLCCCQPQLKHLSGHQQSVLLATVAASAVKPTRKWMLAFEVASARLAHHYSPRDLSMLLETMARMGHKPARRWMQKLIVAVGRSLHLFSPHSLASSLWACAALDECPGQEFIDLFFTESYAKLPRFAAHDLVRILWALSVFHHKPPQHWLSAALAELAPKLPALRTWRVAAVGPILVTLDVVPAGAWTKRYVEVVGENMGAMSGEEWEMVEEAVGQLDRETQQPYLQRLRALKWQSNASFQFQRQS